MKVLLEVTPSVTGYDIIEKFIKSTTKKEDIFIVSKTSQALQDIKKYAELNDHKIIITKDFNEALEITEDEFGYCIVLFEDIKELRDIEEEVKKSNTLREECIIKISTLLVI